MTNLPWWAYVVLAGLSWGTYVPLIFFGGSELSTRPGTIGGRLASILCVGIAYFVLAVIIPVVIMQTGEDAKPSWKLTGLVFSGLAGVAGALGAICVIFASKAAVDQAVLEGAVTFQEKAVYRIYIAPLIFCLAPMINTLLSLIWQPKADNPLNFHFERPSWMLIVGIVLIAGGVFLVLFSKESAEAAKGPGGPPKPVAPAPDQPAPAPSGS